MTPRTREPENVEADLTLLSMPCLARDVKVMPTPDLAPHELLTDLGPRPGTDNNKLQQEEEDASPLSNRPMTRPLANTDIFVDNFIQLGQGGPRGMHTMRRHL